MKTIAIIGAGVMGSDIASNLACFNYNVLLKDLDKSKLTQAEEKIKKDFRMYKMINSNYKNVELKDLIGNIKFIEDYDDFDKVDMIIENISENLDLKKNLYLELKQHCNIQAIYAVNTSCISITEIASFLSDSSKVIGMHFMNPTPMKEMVEVVKGFHTSEDTIEKSKQFIKSLKKLPVVVNDYPGFVANRLSHLFMNEAAFLVQDQVATPKEIDIIFKKGYGHAMGPLETADLIGLDTVVNSLNILYNSYQDTKFRCCPLLQKMVKAGLLGKKSGEGFYKYQ